MRKEYLLIHYTTTDSLVEHNVKFVRKSMKELLAERLGNKPHTQMYWINKRIVVDNCSIRNDRCPILLYLN